MLKKNKEENKKDKAEESPVCVKSNDVSPLKT